MFSTWFNGNTMLRFLVAVFMLLSCVEKCITAKGDSGNGYTLDSVRASLVRQEDTIVFGVIERTRFPLNSPTYQQSYIPRFSGSLLDFIVDQTEAIQSEVYSLVASPNSFTRSLLSICVFVVNSKFQMLLMYIEVLLQQGILVGCGRWS